MHSAAAPPSYHPVPTRNRAQGTVFEVMNMLIEEKLCAQCQQGLKTHDAKLRHVLTMDEALDM
jgi:hypothetical protein